MEAYSRRKGPEQRTKKKEENTKIKGGHGVLLKGHGVPFVNFSRHFCEQEVARARALEGHGVPLLRFSPYYIVGARRAPHYLGLFQALFFAI